MSSITSPDASSRNLKISLLTLLQAFMLQGLGEILMLCQREHKIFLGKMYSENGKYFIRDQGYLSGIKAESLLPCWDYGILGAVYIKSDAQWDSLTFCGLEHCDLKVDLSKTSHLALQAAENQYGDHLIDFIGGVYHGFQLMLDNHFLPVVLLKQIRIITGENGLAVTDLRAAPLPLATILNVNNIVSESINKHLTSGFDDMQVNAEQFDRIFHDYLPKV